MESCHESAVGDLCFDGVVGGMPFIVLLPETVNVPELSAAPSHPGECLVIVASTGNFVAGAPGQYGSVNGTDTVVTRSAAAASDNFRIHTGSRVSAVARGQCAGCHPGNPFGETGV
jgi:mono/diheme cytochrome c family protein